MVATRQKTGNSRPKVWHEEGEKPLPIKSGATHAKVTLAKKQKGPKKATVSRGPSSISSTDVMIHDMSSEKSVQIIEQPAPVPVVHLTVDLEKEIKKLISKIFKYVNEVRPHVLKQAKSKGVLLMRQDYGWIRLQKFDSDIALTVTPILKVLSCTLSTGIPDLFPTKAILRVKYSCYNEETAAEKLHLPDFTKMLDAINTMFCDEYKDQILQKLHQHLKQLENELSFMKTWVSEPKKTMSFLQKHTGMKAPVEHATYVPAITCTNCLHNVSHHLHADRSSFHFGCPDRSFKKRKWDDMTLCGNEHNIHEFLWMDRRIAFIDHPVLDEPIVMLRRSAKVLTFLAPDQCFEVHSQQGRKMFQDVVSLFKNSKSYTYVSDHEDEVSSDDEAIYW